MRPINVILSGLAIVWLTDSAIALANTEPPAAYDARSVGMGSTGVAYAHNGAALFYNPAALHGVKQGALTLDISPLIPQLTSPLGGDGTSVESSRSVSPMFLVGGAYRVCPKLVLGLAVFPTMGFGAEYADAPELGGATLKAQLGAIEIAPGASFALTDDIAIGASYRATYMSFAMESPVPVDADGNTTQSEVDLSSWGFTGFQVGVFARATKTTRLGLTYRNKVSVNMSGETKLGGQSFDTEMEFASPHTFKLGIAQSLLEDRLLLALDGRLALYRESGEDMVVKADVPGAGTVPTTMTLNWRNTVGMYAGAEYRFIPQAAARVGYSLIRSATPKAQAQPILASPGWEHAIHAGAGATISSVDVDLGGYYMFGSKSASPRNGNFSGDYEMTTIVIALSGTYRW